MSVLFEDIRDTPDKAQRIFDRLVEMFEDHDINPSPINYYVWYEYVRGNHPKFRQEMDAVLNDPFGYNDRVGKRLYEEYLKDEEESSNEFDRAFRRLIGVMVKKMNALTDRIDSHAEELDRYSSELADPNIDPQKIKSITESVLNAANDMKQNNEAFQKEFIASSEEVKELRQQLLDAQSEALTDELTQIGNRKCFNNSIEELMLNNLETPEQLCLVLTDLDYFKKFNDTYGHLVGDSILRYFSNMMTKMTGENETVCRYGGEEFAILFNQSSVEAAKEKTDEIRVTMGNAQLKRKDQDKPISKVTASFGLAVFRANDTAETFIARADKALYAAKEGGRNQVLTEFDLESE